MQVQQNLGKPLLTLIPKEKRKHVDVGWEAAHRAEHQLLCGLKQKTENGREETSRQEGIRFPPKCVGYSVHSLPLAYSKKQGFSLRLTVW